MSLPPNSRRKEERNSKYNYKCEAMMARMMITKRRKRVPI